MATHGAAGASGIHAQGEQRPKLPRLSGQRLQYVSERDGAASIQCRTCGRRQTPMRRIADHAKHAERKVSFDGSFRHRATFEIDCRATGLAPECLFLGGIGDNPANVEQALRTWSAEYPTQSWICLQHVSVGPHGLGHDNIAGLQRRIEPASKPETDHCSRAGICQLSRCIQRPIRSTTADRHDTAKPPRQPCLSCQADDDTNEWAIWRHVQRVTNAP